ncbi:hypothetical protein ElyMa_002530500 [Elysia marginata]|uniref:SMODS and SLOG-associating 2TM effector domain-containing protein n=1 Tax=Elysia marginata TaxID=1093978 RepID=A0AAV4GT40_9GAST|nr:hypothetical protein ElyMa_002530500 [Elysia marginata]
MDHAASMSPTAPLFYPDLPSGPVREARNNIQVTPDQNFRLQEVARLKKHIEDDRDYRAHVYKKYQRVVGTADFISTALITISMGLNTAGCGLLTTVVDTPIIIGLECVALGCGALSLASSFISRKLSVKAKKHDEIRVLADCKLNSIAGLVSAALVDGQISDEEFLTVIDEANKYAQMKAEVVARTAATLTAETKLSLIQKGRNEARASIMEKLSKSP